MTRSSFKIYLGGPAQTHVEMAVSHRLYRMLRDLGVD